MQFSKQFTPRWLGAFLIGMLFGWMAQSYAQTAHMYWVEDGAIEAIKSVEVGQTNVATVVNTGLGNPGGIDVDTVNNKLYWVNRNNDNIQRSNLDGSSIETIVTGTPTPVEIAVDPSGGNIYWAPLGSNSIMRADLDGSNATSIVTLAGTQNPSGVALDTTGGKIYWITRGDTTVQRSNLDGSSAEVLFSTGIASVSTEMALDVASGKLFWGTFGTGAIQTANMDGTGSVSDFKTGLSNPVGLDIDPIAQKIYWVERNANSASRSNLDGSSTEVLLTGLDSPRRIAVSPIPEPSTYALILGGVILGVVLFWRRRRSEQ